MNSLIHELLPWGNILSFLKRRTHLNRRELLNTLEEEAAKREGQATAIRKAMEQIEGETWENEDR